jgi:hypothetical protein
MAWYLPQSSDQTNPRTLERQRRGEVEIIAAKRESVKGNDQCRLCEERRPLQQSHIIPKFVYTWLKETSATGHLRYGGCMNRRVQDGLKRPFLCAECEGRLGVWESEFAARVFIPAHRNESPPFPYGEWCAKFVASVSWRVLMFLKAERELPPMMPVRAARAAEAASVWRNFLLGRTPHPGGFELHGLILGPLKSTTAPNMPANMNRYLCRSVEVAFGYSDRLFFTFAKLCQIVLLGFVEMDYPHRWKGTRIRVRKGCFGSRFVSVPGSIMGFLYKRAENMRRLDQSISPRQLGRIDEAYAEDPQRVDASETVRAAIRDAEMFGNDPPPF